MNALYEMKIGDILYSSKGIYEILRVPNGWVYTHFAEETKIDGYGNNVLNYRNSSCFVPFSLEGMEDE